MCLKLLEHHTEKNMLVTLKEILAETRENQYAVGAFDSFDPLNTEFIITAAEKKNVPVILMVCDYSFGGPSADWFFTHAIDRARRAAVPVCVHLDHGPSFEAVMKAIHYGCSSVMIDGSSLPYEENVALTKKVVEVAHACDVSVEAEIGHVAGHEGNTEDGNVADETAYTRLEDAVSFYEATGVDALAVAIGTVHGIYKGEPKLDFDRLDAIRNAIPVPLVMHGGSGLSAQNFKDAVAHGISKINFYTGMSVAGANAARDYLNERKIADMGEVVEAGYTASYNMVSEHLDIFGTQPLKHMKR